jgi:hypothetical protein
VTDCEHRIERQHRFLKDHRGDATSQPFEHDIVLCQQVSVAGCESSRQHCCGAAERSQKREDVTRLAKDLARTQRGIDVTNRVDVTLAMKSRVQVLGR